VLAVQYCTELNSENENVVLGEAFKHEQQTIAIRVCSLFNF
jgi:hypothetical protein